MTTTEPRRFHLTRNYSLASLGLIVMVSILMSYAYHHNAEFELIRQGEDKNHVQVLLLLNALDANAKAQLFALIGLEAAPGKDDERVKFLHQALSRLVAGSSVRKVKFYNARGLTVYSSEANQIGEDKRLNPGYQAAMVGGRSSDLTHRGSFSTFDGDRHDVDVLGSYLPVQDEFRRIIGVIEIYDDVSLLVRAIAETRLKVFGIIFALMFLLYGALMLIVARADRIITEHAREMRDEAARREQALALAERDRHLAELARRDADAQRLAAESARVDADRANRAKSDFLANMSHEIRTPMNGIIGFADLISVDHLPEEQREYLSLIKGSAIGLLDIINDILDLSKVEAGKLELRSEYFSPRLLINQLMRSIKPRAAAKGLELRDTYAPDLPAHVKGDSLRLRQVLLNLLSNAIKFTHAGSISVDVRLSRLEHHATLEIRVRDTGIGIAPADLARIFQPFEQVHTSNSQKLSGTGLGLTISMRLVQLMNGEIRVDSKLGEGTEFCFTAMFEAVQVGEHVVADNVVLPPATPALPPGRRMVLLVEDQVLNQRVAQAMLKRIGVDVTIANGGREGVEIALQDGISLVLMDVQMPDMDGLEATRQIRAAEARGGRAAIPIIALTANAMEGDKQACLDAGMNGFLSKPYQLTDLEQMVRRYLVLSDSAA